MSRNTVVVLIYHRDKHIRSYVILSKLTYIFSMNITRSEREIQPFKSKSTGQRPVFTLALLVLWRLERC
jgi:hypothetical protein